MGEGREEETAAPLCLSCVRLLGQPHEFRRTLHLAPQWVAPAETCSETELVPHHHDKAKNIINKSRFAYAAVDLCERLTGTRVRVFTMGGGRVMWPWNKEKTKTT
jgi:hypothetical protein